MKKLILIISACLMAMTAFARTNIGQYESYGNMYNVDYQKAEDGTEYLNIVVSGEISSDKPEIILRGSASIVNFHNDLLALRSKYCEWVKVAKENNVTDMRKEIPVEFNSVIVGWYTSDWHFDLNQTLRWMFLANVSISGETYYALLTGEKAACSSNKYITQKYYLMFYDVEELDSLIELTDIDVIHKKINSVTGQESLFN